MIAFKLNFFDKVKYRISVNWEDNVLKLIKGVFFILFNIELYYNKNLGNYN